MTTPVYRRQPTLVMETDVAQVAGGGRAGWVSGSPSGLAAATSVTVIFDLGPEWDQYGLVDLAFFPVAPSSGFSNVSAAGSDTAALNSARKLQLVASTALGNLFSASLLSTNGALGATARPMGRYVILLLTNADATNALGASSKVTLTAFVT